MKNGDIVMLENVRFNAEENLTLNRKRRKRRTWCGKLSPMADVFVNDAFGTATAHSRPSSASPWPCVPRQAS